MNRPSAAIGTATWLLAAPGLVCGVLPWLITRWQRPESSWVLLDATAALLCLAGTIVLLHAFVEFAWHGNGTPAPPAPTERLVVRGAYRFVRNPMYVAVLAVVLGQVIAFRSWSLVAYLGVIGVAMAGFVRIYEEPALRRAYGAEYAAYLAAVPRWIPRLTPWVRRDPPATAGPSRH